MAIKEKSNHQIPNNLRRLEHLDQWLAEGDWRPWAIICPKVKHSGTVTLADHVHGVEMIPELVGLVEFVRARFQVAANSIDNPPTSMGKLC